MQRKAESERSRRGERETAEIEKKILQDDSAAEQVWRAAAAEQGRGRMEAGSRVLFVAD